MARRTDALAQYRAKRSFGATPEPEGRAATRAHGIYVIQKHDATTLHYDLRLELDGTLKSWAVTRGPSLDPSVKRLAVHVEDHPVDYASFEGTIPKGNYGAGTVIIWDRGHWEPVGDPHKGLAAGKLAFHLFGERLKGLWALVRLRPKRGEKHESWLLIKERDEEADSKRDLLSQYVTSVVTGRDLNDVASGRTRPNGNRRRSYAELPAFIEPQLATQVDETPHGGDWLFEVKFDGYRLLMAASGNAVKLYTRSGQDWTARFPPLARAARALDLNGALIDGEVVVFNDSGVSDFGKLQQAIDEDKGAFSFFAFDLLLDRGIDLRERPLRERKALLRDRLTAAGRRGPIFYADHIEGDGQSMLKALCGEGYEGVIAKRGGDPYRSGRGRSWLKIKCAHEQEFVILGYSPSTRGRAFSSIALGLNEKGKLRYAGRVGSGFSESELSRLATRFKKLERKAPPISGPAPSSIARNMRWLEPKLVAQVAFAGFTRDNLVRQGRFIGLREDKAPSEVRRETAVALSRTGTGSQQTMRGKPMSAPRRNSADVTIAGVRLSHPDKVLYPEIGATKRELAEYYDAIAERMMPHVEGRMISLVRAPDGVGGEVFFQRHVGSTLPKVFRRVPYTDERGDEREYMMFADASALVAAAQFGVLEIHIWGSRAKQPDKSDRMVFDLDPDEGLSFAKVRAAAFDLREVLKALGLSSFAMVTGGKGVHVVVPVDGGPDWPTLSGFAAAVAQRMVEADRQRFVATMSKAKRKGKIFIDYFRNAPFATAIAPYSSRAKSRATIACPISWEDLPGLDSAAAFTIRDSHVLLTRPEPWPDYFAIRQRLTNKARQALGQVAGKSG
jgi:bifunctional non-homologous end joining protein LigD